MKKAIVLVISIISLCATSIPSFAADIKSVSDTNYAYMNIETAPIEIRDDILEARNAIIFSSGWTTGNLKGYIIKDDGTKEALPDFYDIFPADWEIPTISNMQEIELINAGATRSSKYVSSWIFKAEAGKLAQPVYSTYATQTNWSTTVIEIPDSTVNVGYTDYNAEDMGWAPNLKEGYTFAMGGFTIGQPYSLRASSPQIEGDATFHLTY